ncbi:sugar kinase [Leucobacter chromiisoli]|uniref:sugar kinase n=1 Tax=Leucobacter chromiisoli TaxID=2796471 RepID=UPI0027DE14C4|nr:sugar kinase [Leucobacter chromiisoli]
MTEFPIERGPQPPEVEVLCIGETMVMVAPTPPGPLTDPGTALRLSIGGAESNVAMSLAQLGISAGWWSRLSDDPLGHFVHDLIAEHLVDTRSVEFDEIRPTGLYLKDQASGETRVTYYRQGSAASAMSPRDRGRLPAWTRLLHLSGITPALSPGADALVEELLDAPRPAGRRVSFDINHRPPLWSAEEAGARLHALAAKADIVFVGLDEAHRIWNTATPDEVRALLPAVPQLVVKDGPRAACAYTAAGVTRVPAPPAEVTEVVGAGDAFAAGYLAAELRGLPTRRALMAGHLAAREAIKITSDVPALPRLDSLLDEAPRIWAAADAPLRPAPDSPPLAKENR